MRGKKIGRENKNSQKSRNSGYVNGGGVGAHGQLFPGPNMRSPGTKYKHSKNIFPVISTDRTCGKDCWSFPRSL